MKMDCSTVQRPIYSGKDIDSVQILLDINTAALLVKNIREQLSAGQGPLALVSEVETSETPSLDIASRMFDLTARPDAPVIVARNFCGEDYPYLAKIARVEFFEGVSAQGVLRWPLSPAGVCEIEIEPVRYRAVIFEIKTDA